MMDINIVKVNINQIEDHYIPKIKYILTEIGYRIGVKFIISSDEDSILYTPEILNSSDNVHFIFNSYFYDEKINSSLREGIDFEKIKSKNRKQDLIGFCFYQLMLGDEKYIDSSNKLKDGNFLTKFLPKYKKQYASKSIVEETCNLISHLIGHKSKSKSYLPNGKSSVLCLTHDTDRLNNHNIRELTYNMAKFILRKDLVFFRETINAIKNANSSDIFQLWLKLKKECDIKSCFYLSNRANLPLTINDVRTRVDNTKINIKAVKELFKLGHEFGLHPIINAKYDQEEFALSKKFIQDKFNFSIHGIRHHYWSLNWYKPYLTYRKHENAGFKYDTSVAWKDLAGFRSGTCIPYRTYDIERNRELDHYTLPTSIMDSHIVPTKLDLNQEDLFKIENDFLNILRIIEKFNGALVLDWHTELITAKYYGKNTLNTVLELIQKHVNLSETWITTPWEFIEFYNHNRKNFEVK